MPVPHHELSTPPEADDATVVAALAAGVAEAEAAGAPRVRWWVAGAGERHERLAAAAGLAPTRRLHQMRVPLPLADTTDLPTRPHRPGRDDAALLAVNNDAFAWHPDQGGWTSAELDARRAEPWFRAEDLLVHEGDGAIDGFCWTKVHDDLRPRAGEIYVIAVDPRHQGRGLGRRLVLAGLHHLAHRRGCEVGMLYVEADNRPALALYEGLGFAIARTDVAFTRELGAGGRAPG